MYGCGVLIGIIVAGGSACSCSYESAVFGFLTAVFLQAGTFALNDFYDLESDIANQRRDRPLVRGELKKEEALLVACVAVVVGLFFASFLGWVLFLLASVLAVLGVLYDVKLKEVLAVSNIYIAFTMAVPFVFGGLIAEPTAVGAAVGAGAGAGVGAGAGAGTGAGGGAGEEVALLVLSSIAFSAGFGREVMKDIEDAKGDALRGVRSLARVYGLERAKQVVVFSYSAAVLLSAVPFFLADTSYFLNPAYLLPILVADALFVHASFRLFFGGEEKQLRKETLVAVAAGLVAFVAGALVRL